MRYLRFVVKSFCLLCVAALLLYHFQDFERARLRSQINRLEEEKVQLQQYVDHLRGSRRVAQVEVLDRYPNDLGQVINRLQWQEVRADGTLSAPRFLTALGDQVYFEGLVLKFDYDWVQAGDAIRGQSLVLFRRVFGDQEPAESVAEFERHHLPASAASSGSRESHLQMWHRFWELIDDPSLRMNYGVRVAQCEAPSVRLKAGQVWQIDLAAAGGLDILKLADSRREHEYWVRTPGRQGANSYALSKAGDSRISE